MKLLLPLSVLFTLMAPVATSAAVIINEVAWMGGSVSANHEWVELYNTSGEADLTGWVLTDGNNLTVNLAGTLAESSYAVLERTSDDSAPGAAFLVYTGALSNSGATLTLRRADGTIEDQVAGGTDWSQIGGDNTSKQTAQYTSSGWVTALSTPGAANATAAAIQTASTTQKTVSTSNTSGSSKLAEPAVRPVALRTLTLPNDTLSLTVTGPTIGYVHQPITLTAVPQGLGKVLLDSVVYEWNPGDGTSKSGSGTTVQHTFTHPGRYVVSVYGSFARHEAEGRSEITILPVTLSLTKNAAGDVQINNDAPYEITLDGYTLRAEKTVTLPPRTYLLPQQTITVAGDRLGATHTVALRDARQAVVAVLGLKAPDSSPVLSAQSVSYGAVLPYESPATVVPEVPVEQFGFATGAAATASFPFLSSLRTTSSTVITPVPAANPSTSSWWPYLAFGVLILGTAGLLLVQPKRTHGSSSMHE